MRNPANGLAPPVTPQNIKVAIASEVGGNNTVHTKGVRSNFTLRNHLSEILITVVQVKFNFSRHL